VELAEFEEQMKMLHATSVDGLAKAEGKTEGGAGVVLRLLGRIRGPLPEKIAGRVRSLSYPEIVALDCSRRNICTPCAHLVRQPFQADRSGWKA
jgi:hypothetical protein